MMIVGSKIGLPFFKVYVYYYHAVVRSIPPSAISEDNLSIGWKLEQKMYEYHI